MSVSLLRILVFKRANGNESIDLPAVRDTFALLMRTIYAGIMGAITLVSSSLNVVVPYINPAILTFEPYYEIKVEKEYISPEDTEAVKAHVREKAAQAGINPEFAICITRIESGGFSPSVIQGDRDGDGHILDKNGNPHRSRGLWQINYLAHSSTAPDQIAYDVVESTRWAIPRLKAEPWIWTGSYPQCKHLE